MTKNEFYDVVMQAVRPTSKLIGMIPTDKLNWRPGPTFMSMGQLIYHLTAGVGVDLDTMLNNKWPPAGEMEAAMKLENLPTCGVQDGLERLEKDNQILRKTLDGITEADFANRVVSVPWGWKGKLEIMAVNFLGHFTTHKMQLFTYLKLLGLPVNTETLYGA